MALHRDIFALAEKLMSMSPDVWARHANPLSVYTRIAGGTAVFFALWSPFWLGWWSVLAIGLAGLWIWLNPRLFPPPSDTRSWAARGVLGERAFLRRAVVAIPSEHARMGHISTGIAGIFLVITAVAFYRENFWFAFTAWHAATLAKVWFVDRMAWLWDDMKDANDLYRAWDRAEWHFEEPSVTRAEVS